MLLAPGCEDSSVCHPASILIPISTHALEGLLATDNTHAGPILEKEKGKGKILSTKENNKSVLFDPHNVPQSMTQCLYLVTGW